MPIYLDSNSGMVVSANNRDVRAVPGPSKSLLSAVDRFMNCHIADLSVVSSELLRSVELWQSCERLDRTAFSGIGRRLMDYCGHRGLHPTSVDDAYTGFEEKDAVARFDALPEHELSALLPVLKLCNCIMASHEMRPVGGFGPGPRVRPDTLHPLFFSSQPEMVYEALLPLWPDASPARTFGGRVPTTLPKHVANTITAIAAGTDDWPSAEALFNAIVADDGSGSAKILAAITDGEEVSDLSDDRLCLNARIAFAELRKNTTDPSSRRNSLVWMLRARIAALLALPRASSFSSLMRTPVGTFVRQLLSVSSQLGKLIGVHRDSIDEGLAADLVLLAQAVADVTPQANLATRGLSPQAQSVGRRLADRSVAVVRLQSTFLENLERQRLVESVVGLSDRVPARTRGAVITLAVTIMHNNPLLAPRTIMDTCITIEERRMMHDEQRNNAAVDAGAVGALLNVAREIMWHCTDELEASRQELEQRQASGSLSISADAGNQVPLPTNPDSINVQRLSAKDIASLCHALEILAHITQLSHHQAANPVQFLLGDRALMLTLKRWLTLASTVPPIYGATCVLLSAAIHHNVRDVVPALIEQGFLQLVLSQLESLPAEADPTVALFTPQLITAFAVHNMTADTLAEASQYLSHLIAPLMVANQTSSPPPQLSGDAAVNIVDVAPVLGRNIAELCRAVPAFVRHYSESLVAHVNALCETMASLRGGVADPQQLGTQLRNQVVRPLVTFLSLTGTVMQSLRSNNNAASAPTDLRQPEVSRSVATLLSQLLEMDLPLEPVRALAQYLRLCDSSDFNLIWTPIARYVQHLRVTIDEEAQASARNAAVREDSDVAFAAPSAVTENQMQVLVYCIELCSTMERVSVNGSSRRAPHDVTAEARSALISTLVHIYFAVKCTVAAQGQSLTDSDTSIRRVRTVVMDGMSPAGSTVMHSPESVPRNRRVAFLRSVDQLLSGSEHVRSNMSHDMRVIGLRGEDFGLGIDRRRETIDLSSIFRPILREVDHMLSNPSCTADSSEMRIAATKLEAFATMCNSQSNNNSGIHHGTDDSILPSICSKALSAVTSNPTAVTPRKVLLQLFEILRGMLQARFASRHHSRRLGVVECVVLLMEHPHRDSVLNDNGIDRLVLDILSAAAKESNLFEHARSTFTESPVMHPSPLRRVRPFTRMPVPEQVRDVRDQIATLVTSGYSELEASVALENTNFSVRHAYQWLEADEATRPIVEERAREEVEEANMNAQRERLELASAVTREAGDPPPLRLKEQIVTWSCSLLLSILSKATGNDASPANERGSAAAAHRGCCRLFWLLISTHRMADAVVRGVLQFFDESPVERSAVLGLLASLWTQRNLASLRMRIARTTGLVDYLAQVLERQASVCVRAVLMNVATDILRLLQVMGSSLAPEGARICDHFLRGFCWNGIWCSNQHCERPRFEIEVAPLDQLSVRAVAEFCMERGFGEPEGPKTAERLLHVLCFVPDITFIDSAQCATTVVELLAHSFDAPPRGDGVEGGMDGDDDVTRSKSSTPTKEEDALLTFGSAILQRIFTASPQIARMPAVDRPMQKLAVLIARLSQPPKDAVKLLSAYFDDVENTLFVASQEMRRVAQSIVAEDKDEGRMHTTIDAETLQCLRNKATVTGSPVSLSTPFPTEEGFGSVPVTPATTTISQTHFDPLLDVPPLQTSVAIPDIVEFIHAAEAIRLRTPFAFKAVLDGAIIIARPPSNPEDRRAWHGSAAPMRYIFVPPRRPPKAWRDSRRECAEKVFQAVIDAHLFNHAGQVAPTPTLVALLAELTTHNHFASLVLRPLPPRLSLATADKDDDVATLQAPEGPISLLAAATSVAVESRRAAAARRNNPSRDWGGSTPLGSAMIGANHNRLFRNVASRHPAKVASDLAAHFVAAVGSKNARNAGVAAQSLEAFKAGGAKSAKCSQELRSPALLTALLNLLSLKDFSVTAKNRQDTIQALESAVSLFNLVVTPTAHIAIAAEEAVAAPGAAARDAAAGNDDDDVAEADGPSDAIQLVLHPDGRVEVGEGNDDIDPGLAADLAHLVEQAQHEDAADEEELLAEHRDGDDPHDAHGDVHAVDEQEGDEMGDDDEDDGDEDEGDEADEDFTGEFDPYDRALAGIPTHGSDGMGDGDDDGPDFEDLGSPSDVIRHILESQSRGDPVDPRTQFLADRLFRNFGQRGLGAHGDTRATQPPQGILGVILERARETGRYIDNTEVPAAPPSATRESARLSGPIGSRAHSVSPRAADLHPMEETPRTLSPVLHIPTPRPEPELPVPAAPLPQPDLASVNAAIAALFGPAPAAARPSTPLEPSMPLAAAPPNEAELESAVHEVEAQVQEAQAAVQEAEAALHEAEAAMRAVAVAPEASDDDVPSLEDTLVPPEGPVPWADAFDPVFLAELPADLRRDLLRDNMELITIPRVTRTAAGDTHLHPLFLAAIPSDLQAEIVALEQEYHAAREQQQAGQQSHAQASGTAAPAAVPTPSPADELRTLLAMVDPELRMDILLTSDQETLAQAPELLEEAQTLRRRLEEQEHQRQRQAEQAAAAARQAQQPPPAARLPLAGQLQMRRAVTGSPPNVRYETPSPQMGDGAALATRAMAHHHAMMMMRDEEDDFLLDHNMMRRPMMGAGSHENALPPSRRRTSTSATVARPVPPPNLATPAVPLSLTFPAPLAYICRWLVRIWALSEELSDSVLAALIHISTDQTSAMHVLDAIIEACTVDVDDQLLVLLGADPNSHSRGPRRMPSAVAARLMTLLSKLCTRSWWVGQSFWRVFTETNNTFVVDHLDAPISPLEKAAMESAPLPRLFRVVAHAEPNDFVTICDGVTDVLTATLKSWSSQLSEDQSTAEAPPPPPTRDASRVLVHPRHQHPLVWSDPSRTSTRYSKGSVVCNVCQMTSRWLVYHCSQCTFDLCQYCAAMPMDSLDAAKKRLTRQQLLMTECTDMIHSCVEIVMRPNCQGTTAEQIVKILEAAVAASNDRAVSDGSTFSFDSLNAISTALVQTSSVLTKAISDAVQRFRAVGRPRATDSGAVARNALASRFEVLDLDSTAMSNQAYSLFVVQAQRRNHPQVLRKLWHAVSLYFSEMQSALAAVHADKAGGAATQPGGARSATGVALPTSVVPLLVGFARFHILANQDPESMANLGERTETEALLGENNTVRSEVSQEAVVAAKASHEGSEPRRRGPRQPPMTNPFIAQADDALVDEGREPLPPSLLRFVESNRLIINTLIHSDPTLLTGSCRFMSRAPRFIDFEFKYRDFRNRLQHLMRLTPTRLELQVNRQQCFGETFAQLRAKSAPELIAPVHIKFRGEEGADAGGLTREWFQLLSEDIINPNYGLFINSSEGMTFQPNPHSDVNPQHLLYFRFAGRVVGLAVLHEVPIDVHFTRSLYRHLVGVEPGLIDVQSVDPDMYKGLEYVLRTNLDEMDLGLTFTITQERFGVVEEKALVPNGHEVEVTNANKKDYVRRRCAAVMTTLIKDQLVAFMTGFYEIIPRHYVSVFTEQELEFVISGLPEIDVEDLRVNTEYQGYTSSSPQIRWFWEVVAGMSKEDKANLLQFATGASKVPPGGFANLEGLSGKTKFSIVRTDTDVELLPVAHTCFNRIDLPAYTSCDQLREKLMVAITYGCKGFSMV